MNDRVAIIPKENFSDPPQVEIKFAKVRAVEKTHGLGRFTLFRLIREGAIRTVLIKKSKKAKGYRLIDLRSLEEYLNSHATGGN
jgi:hypothetical protein